MARRDGSDIEDELSQRDGLERERREVEQLRAELASLTGPTPVASVEGEGSCDSRDDGGDWDSPPEVNAELLALWQMTR
eukprot:CAMPEP_0205905228 /NCGR_PEP_ID=MMETSP1325-20131115/1225_1 /ASSEMBLY_ACC=CAM_ASM_000708 /TAXON_ID=236786 /ORGANISM="Florenciella sp., Strain RCC1007" /LENGTH=78 /DNA_ID=CAMNT_0053271115 /DNA_START=19 /DNA_END=252 /DNA_ORIENTATION=+